MPLMTPEAKKLVQVLNPCPCGGTVRNGWLDIYVYFPHKPGRTKYAVECHACPLDSGMHNTRQGAINAWNEIKYRLLSKKWVEANDKRNAEVS